MANYYFVHNVWEKGLIYLCLELDTQKTGFKNEITFQGLLTIIGQYINSWFIIPSIHTYKNIKLKTLFPVDPLRTSGLATGPQSFHGWVFAVQSSIKLFFTNTMSVLFIVFSCHHNFIVVWTVSEQLPSFPWVTDRAARQDKKQNERDEQQTPNSVQVLLQLRSASVDLNSVIKLLWHSDPRDSAARPTRRHF